MTDNDTTTASGRPLVEIYHKTWCPYCHAALRLLDNKGVAYRAIDVTTDRARERQMIERSGRHTVPEIFVDGELIGGFDDLAALDREGSLDGLLGGRRDAA